MSSRSSSPKSTSKKSNISNLSPKSKIIIERIIQISLDKDEVLTKDHDIAKITNH